MFAHLRKHGGALILLAMLLLVGSLTTLSVLATRPADELNLRTYLPIVAKQPTPTPTPTPINVSGAYWAVSSNLVENCDGDYNKPADQDVVVVQNGTDLTNLAMTFPAGTCSGTINPYTGAFEVSQKISPGATSLCPYGCNRTTSGVFRLDQNPLIFDATTTFEILNTQGGVYCTYSFDQIGTHK